MLTIENFINGEFVSAKSYLQSFNPATGEAHALVPDSSAEDVEKAVSAAEVAFERYALAHMLRLFFRVVSYAPRFIFYNVLFRLEAATRGVLCKKVFLEISQNSQENICARVSF